MPRLWNGCIYFLVSMSAIEAARIPKPIKARIGPVSNEHQWMWTQSDVGWPDRSRVKVPEASTYL